jgi:prepilin-type N-terminal cleavage/methylation domain-containing protein
MRRAFTLIELLIVIGVMGLLVGLSSLSLVSFGKGSELDSGRTTVVQALREAQSDSLANLGNNPWGVHFETNKVVIYQDTGSGYNPADIANNRTKLFPKGVVASWNLTGGTNYLLFDKGLGTTLNNGSITISSTANTTATITINSEGMIDY